MAGIGLTLRRLVADQTYLHGTLAYFSSGVIAAGPWLISVVSLALLQSAVAAFLSPDDRQLLFATITYAFVGSLIITGPVQIVLTRRVADYIFLREQAAIAATFTRAGGWCLVGLLLALLPLWVFAPFELVYRWLAGSLFLTVALMWLALAVLSAAQDYRSLVLAFGLGYALSGGALVWLGRRYGLLGALAGFSLGQVVCLGLLSQRVYAEFPQLGGMPSLRPWDWRAHWRLAGVGFLYYFGLWSDKIIYWFSPESITVRGFYRVFPPYDSAIWLAYLLTIPASAVFLVNLETDFYLPYRAFYMHLLRRTETEDRQAPVGTFEQITQARRAMLKAARSGFVTLLKVQGMIGCLASILAPDLARWVGLPAEHLSTLRLTIWAAGGQVFVLYAMLLLLYVDAQGQALKLTFVFAVSNLGLTLLTASLAPQAYGLGYLLSTITAGLVGMKLLNSTLGQLDYPIFMLQPLEPARQSQAARKRLSPTAKADKPPHSKLFGL